MNDVKITVGGQMEEQAAGRFVDAWHRAEQGQSFRLRHLAFESWDALARVLTGKRMELLRYVRHHTVSSVRALAKALGRLESLSDHPPPHRYRSNSFWHGHPKWARLGRRMHQAPLRAEPQVAATPFVDPRPAIWHNN